MFNHFETADKMMDWVDARRREADPQRRDQEMYAAYNRAMHGGHQWIQRTSAARGWDVFTNKAAQAAGNNGRAEPMLTTVNRITRMTIRISSNLNPQRLEVFKLPPAGSSSERDLVYGDIMETSANTLINECGLLSSAQRSSFERCVTAQHGFGFRILRGEGDTALEAFEFDGYRLTLDPSNTSLDLRDHRYVIFTDVITWDHAKQIFEPEALSGIREENLRTISSLMPVETRFHEITGGRMYANYAQHANTKGLVVSWVYMRGLGRRFDRLYIVADTGGNSGPGANRDRVAIKYDDPTNPYPGNGLNFALHNGYFRSGARMPISHVGLMVDDQMKANIAATINFQGMWNFVKSTLVIDKAMLGGSNLTEDEIYDRIMRGMLVVNRGGDKNALPPAWLTTPPPSQVVANEMDYWANEIRSSGFHAQIHEGQTKSHVPAHTTQLALDESTMPLDDMHDMDVRAYEAVIETLALTGIKLAAEGSRTIARALIDGGLTDEQLGLMLQMPMDRVPCRLQIARDAIIRRSRGRRYQEIVEMANTGLITPDQLPSLLAEIDMPISQGDRDSERWANQSLARVVNGAPFMPVFQGPNLPIFLNALRKIQMRHSGNPEVMQRLYQAFDQQMEVEAEFAGGGEEQAPPPEAPFPPQVTLDQVAGLAPIQ